MNSVLGTGLAYPFKRGSGGDWLMASGIDSVRMGITQIVRTGIGQRPMWKDIGINFGKILFMLEGSQRDVVVTEYIKAGINKSEPRAKDIICTVKDSDEGGSVYITIQYADIITNKPDNFVVTVRK